MAEPARDLALVDRLGALYSAVVSDTLDRLGIRGNAMAPHIRPLYPHAKAAGFAATVHCVAVDAPPANREDWYRGELQAVDALAPGDVMVVSTCSGCYWGELLATASLFRGARGIVADAWTRDTLALIEMEFPTFVTDISPLDSLGRIDVDAIGVPVECGGVTVRQGDLVVADADGIVVVPAEAIEPIVSAGRDKLAREDAMRHDLRTGMGIVDAFRKHEIL